MSWNNQTRSVEIAQVVTEPELVERSSELEAALSQPQFGPYCQAKAEAATQPTDQVSVCQRERERESESESESDNREREQGGKWMPFSVTTVPQYFNHVAPECQNV